VRGKVGANVEGKGFCFESKWMTVQAQLIELMALKDPHCSNFFSPFLQSSMDVFSFFFKKKENLFLVHRLKRVKF
jgi:hypothetical protein